MTPAAGRLGPSQKKKHRLATSGEASDLRHAVDVLQAGGRHVEWLSSDEGFRTVEIRIGPGAIARLRDLLKKHKNCELCRNVTLVQID